MRIRERAINAPEWLKSSKELSDKVLFSAVTVRRNLLDAAFPNQADENELLDVLEKLAVAIALLPDASGDFYKLSVISDDECSLLYERWIPVDCKSRNDVKGVFVSQTEHLSILINHTDHIEIQGVAGGLSVRQVLDHAEKAEWFIGSLMEYAFADTIGFLTANPFEAGLGIDLSVVLHLPGISVTNQTSTLADVVKGAFLDLKPLFPNGIGNLYILKTTRQLGVTEEELYRSFTEVIDIILDLEDGARDTLMSKFSLKIEDRVERAKAILDSARMLSFEELAELISIIKLGISLGLVPSIPFSALDELLVLARPVHLQVIFAENENIQLDSLRASFVRAKLRQRGW